LICWFKSKEKKLQIISLLNYLMEIY